MGDALFYFKSDNFDLQRDILKLLVAFPHKHVFRIMNLNPLLALGRLTRKPILPFFDEIQHIKSKIFFKNCISTILWFLSSKSGQ